MKCTVIGPRGGLSIADVKCDTCVCAGKCSYSGPSRMGCFDWVSPAGHRWYSTGILAADLPVEVAEATMEYDKEDTHEQGKE